MLSRRSPRGERGLKLLLPLVLLLPLLGRSPRGERGLKYVQIRLKKLEQQRRSPRGERGLKLATIRLAIYLIRSLPSRGAWIEMFTIALLIGSGRRRSPRGERGLKWLRGVQL